MDNKEKILATIFEEDAPMHIRLLAKKVRVSPNTVSTIVKELERENLVETKKDYNRLLVMPADTPEYKRKKTHYTIEKLYTIKLIEYLCAELAYPTIILFGSCAKGENHSASDIDLFIIADEKKELDLEPFEQKLKVPIQLFIHTKKEFKAMQKTNKELLNNVLNGIKLEGFIEVFE